MKIKQGVGNRGKASTIKNRIGKTTSAKPVKKTLSLSMPVRSTLEYVLHRLGGKVGPAETSSKLLSDFATTYARLEAERGSASLFYDLIPLVDDRPICETHKVEIDGATVRLVTPDRKISDISQSDLQMVKDVNGDRSWGLFRLYFILDEAGQLIGKTIFPKYDEKVYVANQSEEWLSLSDKNGFYTDPRSNEDLLKLIIMLYQTQSSDLKEALEELESESYSCMKDQEFMGLYFMEGSEKPFMGSYEADEFGFNSRGLLRVLSRSTGLKVEYENKETEKLSVVGFDADKDTFNESVFDMGRIIHWTPPLDLLKDDQIYVVEDYLGEIPEELYYSEYQSKEESKKFFKEISEKATDKKEMDFLNRDLNILCEGSLNTDIERFLCEFERECYRCQGIIYLYVKNDDEEYTPVGYVRVAFGFSYDKPGIEHLKRHPKIGLGFSTDVRTIYLLPEYRNRGLSSLIARSIMEIYGKSVLSSISDFDQKFFLESMPVSLYFEADTVTPGGMRVMDWLTNEADIIRDESEDIYEIKDLEVDVAYS